MGPELGPSQVLEMCDSFCEIAGSGACAIGADTRDSGPMLRRAAVASLEQNGTDVLDYGVAPAPVIFRESRRTGSGIIITASHNPLEYNGLKFVLDGRGVDAGTLRVAPRRGARHGKVGSYNAAQSTYVDDAAALVGSANAGTCVALDAGGGAALETAKKLLEQIGCTVRVIDTERGPNPVGGRLEELAKASTECDIGLGFDLDGDRVIIARNGQVQSPDATVAIGIAWAQVRGCSKFAVSLDTSSAIDEIIAEKNGSVVQSPVGELCVMNAIDEHGCGAGGEGSSAGFILPEFNYCRDGILAGAIAAIMSSSDALDHILDRVRGGVIRNKVAAPADSHGKIIESVAGLLQDEFVNVNRTDGFYGAADDSTWVLVRGSNTEEAVRVSAESPDAGRAEELAQRIGDMVAGEK